MKLSDYIELKKKDILSIVGAGGKTTMMFKLAEELRVNNKVLVTTTTKIYIPPLHKYDFICTNKDHFIKYSKMKDNGIYVLGLGINEDNKILGLTTKELEGLTPYFDYILIEADGAKEKQLKGWNEFEPILYGKTTKTLGIIDIQSKGILINEDNIHRSEIFSEITGGKYGEAVTLEHLLNLVINPLGLFKGALGEKILFINKVNGPDDFASANLLVNKITLKGNKLPSIVVIGSLKTNIYYK
ncbi:MAG TPA: selenium cofactor biosynthesis protein YqeC [Clostridium sp.]|uniref:selenium cofactor biosynthesis protein YqeC n=1 Tax=Clostridium sp. TaxID=1506 RepID=UPI002F926B8F